MQHHIISIAKFISIDYYIVLLLAAWCPALTPYCVQLILLTVTVNMTEHSFWHESPQTHTLFNAPCNPCSLMH